MQPFSRGGCLAAGLGAGPEAAPDPLNERLVCATAVMDLTILCTNRVSTEQPFTSATE